MNRAAHAFVWIALGLAGLLALAHFLIGCAESHPNPVELACDNYVDTLGCNPSPAFEARPAFTHPACVQAMRALPARQLECLSAIAQCTDAPACVE